MGLGALASLIAFIGRGAARAADALMIDSSGVTLFNGKRNLFTDEENAGNIRVGVAWGVPGIYSEKGAVVVGSQNGNIWLNGEIGIGTATPAALLDVGAGLLHVAANVGTTPTVTSQGAYLGWNALTGGTGETDFINNQGGGSGGFAFMNAPPSGEPRTTLMVIPSAGNVKAKSFDVGEDQGVQIQGTSGRNLFSDSEKAGSLRVGAAWGIPGIYSEKGDVVVGSQSGNIYAGRTKTIPNNILEALCGTPDGCEVRLGMTRRDEPNKTETASIVNRFYYFPGDKHWRTNWPRDTSGIIGNGVKQHVMDVWKTCFFTDGTYKNYQDKGDKGTGMQLLVWNENNNLGYLRTYHNSLIYCERRTRRGYSPGRGLQCANSADLPAAAVANRDRDANQCENWRKFT